mgnify:CR=1 FL=1
MILQISRLAWPNIPPLKLSDIQEYYLSDIPQFLKSTSTAISFRFKINSRWERVSGCCRRREIFFCSLSRTWGYPKENKRKHPEVSKGNMYGYRELYDITMTLRWHYLLQDANNFRDQNSRKTVSRVAKLNRGYCLYIQIYLCQGKARNFSSKIGSFRNNLRYRCILEIFPHENTMRSWIGHID